MSAPYHHACSSARLFGGRPENYQDIHDHLDATKETFADFRHRAVRHHAQGIFDLEREFNRRAVVEAAEELLRAAAGIPELETQSAKMSAALACRYIVNSNGTRVPVRLLGEQHVREDCGGWVPSLADWFRNMRREPWMSKGYHIAGISPTRKREFAEAGDEVGTQAGKA